MAPRKAKPVEPIPGHALEVAYVKTRGRWEGSCECEKWSVYGPKPDTFEGDHAIHLSHQRRPTTHRAA